MISYIVMAAGSSARFQSPKALATIENELCINFLLKKLLSCPIEEIIVVLGAHSDLIHPHLFKHNLIRIVYNNDYNFGQTSSAIAALKEANSASSCYALHPVDCPFVKGETVSHLIQKFNPEICDIAIPSYQFKKGHPPVFNKKIKELILKLNPTAGINTVFDPKSHYVEMVETSDAGVVQSFNTVEELDLILKNRRGSII